MRHDVQPEEKNANANFSPETKEATALFKRLSPSARKEIIAVLRSLALTKE